MTVPFTFAPHLRLRFKGALRQAVQAVGGVDEAGKVCGVSAKHISRCQRADEADMLSLPALLALCEYSASPAFAEMLADLCGMRLCPQRDAEGAGPQGTQAVSAAMSEAAELVHVCAVALADGKISIHEARGIRKPLGDMRDTLADLDRALARIEGG